MRCQKCNAWLKEEDFFWDESGFGYSTKLVKCRECGAITVIKIIEDKGLDVNKDKRFYCYNGDRKDY